MLVITGDTHQKFNRFNNKNFDYSGCSKDNSFIVIAGDFGGIFDSQPNQPETKNEKYWLDWLESKPVTFVVVGGNHENWDTIETNYPISEFHGAKVRFLRPSVVWVERGEIIELDGFHIWCFGGAYSIDKPYRKVGKSWWAREQATEKEFQYGMYNFCDNWDKIDFIITHDVPSQTLKDIYGFDSGYPSETQRYLQQIAWLNKREVPHYCGHIHHDTDINMCGYHVRVRWHDIDKIEKKGDKYETFRLPRKRY